MKRTTLWLTLFVFIALAFIFNAPTANAYTNKENIIDDAVFINESSMSEAQIQAFINQFPNSCLQSQNYPSGLSPATFKTPIDYWTYSTSDSSPAHIIYWSANYYHLNPQVILTTLEKEENLITGSQGCSLGRYNSAMGYDCPDTWTYHTYADINIIDTCVGRESNAGFVRQVSHATWQLRFDEERAYGNVDWGDDGNVTYYGRMTRGYRATVSGGSLIYYDGYTTIDGVPVYISNGSTAALYNYTPHFNNFFNIFTGWFGSTYTPTYSATLQSADSYTDSSKTTTTTASTLNPGQKIYMVLKFKNTGNMVWHNVSGGAGAVRLATLNTSNSPFCDTTWITCYRPAELKETTVNPGSIGTFEFWYKAPVLNSDTSIVTQFGVISEAVAIMSGTQQTQTTLVKAAN